MNAKMILAAVAAVCCVQGISAASLVRPLPWFENTDAATDFDLENVDLEQVIESMILGLEAPLDSADKGKRNIVSCAFSLANVYKTLKEDKAMFDEFQKDKKNYVEDVAKCNEDTDSVEREKCLASKKTAYEDRLNKMKAKLTRQVVKTVTASIALKSCFSIF